jgi:hypothetical protein
VGLETKRKKTHSILTTYTSLKNEKKQDESRHDLRCISFFIGRSVRSLLSFLEDIAITPNHEVKR